MTCVILQPSYIPWRGYFHQIQKADVFVFYDDVQYDVDGWRNRNRIKTPNGPVWLTIPVSAKGVHVNRRRICDIRICWDRQWATTHLKSLRHSYASAAHFKRYEGLLEEWYGSRPELLAEFTISTTIQLARELGIRHTQFLRSSNLKCSGAKTDRVLSVLRQVGATRYVSGPSARAYLEVEKLAVEGIGVEWMSYAYPEYPQLYPPFDPQVSILDLLLTVGPAAGEYIWASPSV
ncbi:MAG TPA: WbqC family protein [Bryobacteraceae bacterium]|nr:WbqC family protein [Bryobacteraceae bacterium]